jgi:hypothetical protein
MKLIEVSSGNNHIAVIACNKDSASDDLGYVFTWGLDLFGRLGYLSDNRRVGMEGETGTINLKIRGIYI